jgi:hypothetical protein
MLMDLQNQITAALKDSQLSALKDQLQAKRTVTQ